MSAVEETSAAIADLPPSCKLILLALRESDRPLSSSELQEITLLVKSTITTALERLVETNVLTSRPSVKDPRKTLYEIADDVDPWGGEQA